MLSRVANSIYWMSRYLERSENIARFIDVNLKLSLDTPTEHGEQWQALLNTTGDHELFAAQYQEASRENVLNFLTFDRENPNSIFCCVRNARENARSVREIISSEMWEQANLFYIMVRDAGNDQSIMENPNKFYQAVKMASHLFDGITEATMSHGEPWHFLQMGELLERADKTSRILDVKYYLLLKSTSAFEMYRKHFKSIAPAKVADFLLLNREFPRSVLSCLTRANYSLNAISGSANNAFSNSAEQNLGKLLADLNFTTIDEILAQGLHEYLDTLQTRLNQVDDEVFHTFFQLRDLEGVRSEDVHQMQIQD
jgi:uncharacterized alpha-E superfamily protein